MKLLEFFLGEMSGMEYNVLSKRIIDQYRQSGIQLILTSHVADQVAYNPERAPMVPSNVFNETMHAILRAFNERKLGKYIYMAGKKPEAHVLFKHRFQTPEGLAGVANVPCAIAKMKGALPFKFTIITFMIKENYQNDNFPQDSVMWLQK